MRRSRRLYVLGLLALMRERHQIELTELPTVWETLCELAALDPALGQAWVERQRGAAQDVRDWLARLEEGDDS